MSTTLLETPDLFAFSAPAAAPTPPPPPAPQAKPAAKIEHLQFKHRVLPGWAADILEDVTVEKKDEAFLVKLHCGQIEPERYALVNEVLDNIGGIWKGGKTNGHNFSYDPSEILLAIQKTKKVPEKNPLDFFPTPKALIRDIVENSRCEWLLSLFRDPENIPENCRVLEPSAGAGNIIETLTEMYPLLKGRVDAVEPNPFNVQALKGLQSHDVVGKIFEDDFLAWQPPEGHTYRICVMNPPFAYKGNKMAYIDHILHAWEILKSNATGQPAVLIAITPTGWIFNMETQKTREFRDLVFLQGGFETLPEESFSESGTKTATCAIHLEYNGKREIATLEEGHAANFTVLIDNKKEYYEEKMALKAEVENLKGQERLEAFKKFFLRMRGKMLRKDGAGIAYTPAILQKVMENLLND